MGLSRRDHASLAAGRLLSIPLGHAGKGIDFPVENFGIGLTGHVLKRKKDSDSGMLAIVCRIFDGHSLRFVGKPIERSSKKAGKGIVLEWRFAWTARPKAGYSA